MGEANLVFLRDLSDVEPPRDRYAHYEEEDIYRLVPRPQWTGLEDEIWTPRSQEHDPQLEKVKALMKRNSTEANGIDSSAAGMTETTSTKFTKCAPRRVASTAPAPLLAARSRCRRSVRRASQQRLRTHDCTVLPSRKDELRET